VQQQDATQGSPEGRFRGLLGRKIERLRSCPNLVPSTIQHLNHLIEFARDRNITAARPLTAREAEELEKALGSNPDPLTVAYYLNQAGIEPNLLPS
jgi:hypothetical protein